MTITLNTLYTWHRPGTPLQQVMPVAINGTIVTLAVLTIYEGYGGGEGHQEASQLRLEQRYLEEQGLDPLPDWKELNGRQKREMRKLVEGVRSDFCRAVFGIEEMAA